MELTINAFAKNMDSYFYIPKSGTWKKVDKVRVASWFFGGVFIGGLLWTISHGAAFIDHLIGRVQKYAGVRKDVTGIAKSSLPIDASKVGRTASSPTAILESHSNTLSNKVDQFAIADRELILEHQLPLDVETSLDEICKDPLPAFGSFELCEVLDKRGIAFIKMAGQYAGSVQFEHSAIGSIVGKPYLIKFQGDKYLFSRSPKANLERIVINDRIRQHVGQNNCRHIAVMEKYIYVLPNLKPLPNGQKHILSDENSFVVAKQINLKDVHFDELTEDQYKEIVNLVVSVGYADTAERNFSWIEENGQNKLVIIDTENRASYFAGIYFNQLLDSRWKTRYNEALKLLESVKELSQTDKESAMKILELLAIYDRGLCPLQPFPTENGTSSAKQSIFDAAKKIIENKIQAAFSACGIDVGTVDL